CNDLESKSTSRGDDLTGGLHQRAVLADEQCSRSWTTSYGRGSAKKMRPGGPTMGHSDTSSEGLVPIPFIRAPDRKQDREWGMGIVRGSVEFSEGPTTSCMELGLAISNPL